MAESQNTSTPLMMEIGSVTSMYLMTEYHKKYDQNLRTPLSESASIQEKRLTIVKTVDYPAAMREL
jgi:hypothetical protein